MAASLSRWGRVTKQIRRPTDPQKPSPPQAKVSPFLADVGLNQREAHLLAQFHIAQMLKPHTADLVPQQVFRNHPC